MPDIDVLFPVFPEDRDITICPTIVTSQATPSFRLQPNSANREFLNGTYVITPDNRIPGAIFDPVDDSCENNPSMICSKLSLLYQSQESVGRGSIRVVYHASNGVTRIIHIDFGELNVL